MKRIFALSLILILTNSNAKNNDSVTIAKIFKNNNGTIVILDINAGKYICYNQKRSMERFLPASTFKIPNALIGLETAVIKDENFIISWDGVKREIEDWNKDLTLDEAIKVSAVPYFQELVRRVGRENYERFFNQFSYGNKNIGHEVDMFWLNNSLKISAVEQVQFLKEMYYYQLPFSKRSIDLVKKILPEERHKRSTMKFKTGMGEKENGIKIGWLIGYIEKESNVYLFAFNVESKEYSEVKKLRNELSRKILTELKILD